MKKGEYHIFFVLMVAIVLTKKENVKMVTTDLIGKEAADVITDFEFDEEGTRGLKCGVGY